MRSDTAATTRIMIFATTFTAISAPAVVAAKSVEDSARKSAGHKCDSSNDNCVEIGRLNLAMAIGLGARSNPLKEGEAIPLVFVPQISYYGERFFFNNFDFGYTLFEDSEQSLNLIASPGYDRVFFYRSDLQNIFVAEASPATSDTSESINDDDSQSSTADPPSSTTDPQSPTYVEHDPHVTYFSGLEWSFGRERFNMQLSYLHEITGRHQGKELRLATALPLIEDGWTLSATVGATWKSAEVVDYYYGEEGIYTPSSALNPFVKLGYETHLNRNWTITIFGHYEKLDSEIVNSPIVDKNEVLTLFIGGIYSF